MTSFSFFCTDKKATNCLGHIFYNYVHEQINNCDLTITNYVMNSQNKQYFWLLLCRNEKKMNCTYQSAVCLLIPKTKSNKYHKYSIAMGLFFPNCNQANRY